MSTTPTGIPISDCDQCGYTHAVTRDHCRKCGLGSVFIDPVGHCLNCQPEGRYCDPL